MRCKHCGKETGGFYSDLDNHIWSEHPQIQIRHLKAQSKPSLKREKKGFPRDEDWEEGITN